MFIWDYSAIIALSLFILLAIVFVMRVFYTLKRGTEASEAGYFRQCPYCGHVYMDFFLHSPCQCPRCLSYHDA